MMYDVAIIGAGITGVSVSLALAKRNRSWRIVVLEKEDDLARHTSGRNSAVVHAGFNPKPGTMKARFCMEGNRRIHDLCRGKGLPLRTAGTLVVARSPSEVEILEELLRRGQANGVPDIALLDRKQLTGLEPHVKGVAALYAPTGAVTDSRAVVKALAHEAADQGVIFQHNEEVTGIEDLGSHLVIRTNNGSPLTCQYMINCGGLHADRIAHWMGIGMNYAIIPFRGEYYVVSENRSAIVGRMVYPVPVLGYPFLGIHFTPSVHGELLAGPNAVLALGREAYGWRETTMKDTLQMLLDQRTWRLFSSPDFRHVAWDYLKTSLSKAAFVREASSLVEGLNGQDFHRGHPPGIRAQLVDDTGRLVDDVVVERNARSIHVLNAVSPGFTCAIPFGEYIASLV